MGGVHTTIKNLEVVQIYVDKDLLLIKGAVPGAPGSDVVVWPANENEVNVVSEVSG